MTSHADLEALGRDGGAVPLTRAAAVAHLARAAEAAPGGGARVGVEQEWHTYLMAEPERHLRPDEVLTAAEAGGALPFRSRITVEPGGQVEISTPPADPWWQCLEAMRVDGAELRRRLASAEILAVPGGVDLFREPLRTLHQPRYDAMQEFFDRKGPQGRRMMSGCAAIQVNVGLGDASEAERRWRLAHMTGPALAAAFACSPSPTNRSDRLANWQAMDPTRTRPARGSGGLAADWAAYALGAEVMFVQEPDGTCAPPERPLTFDEWLDGGIPGRAPSLADLDRHSTTLFPPVRPRGWLELRWVDALPAGAAEAAVAAIAVLLLDERAGTEAEAACAGLTDPEVWQLAAEHGPRHHRLAEIATQLLRIAARAMARTGADPAWAARIGEVADRWPVKRRCPADDLETRLAPGAGPAALADPPSEVTTWLG